VRDEGIVFGVARSGKSKDSLFIAKEFFDAKKLRTLKGAKINSPR